MYKMFISTYMCFMNINTFRNTNKKIVIVVVIYHELEMVRKAYF